MVAVVGFFVRLVNGDILCNVACVRRQIALLRWLHALRRDGWGETGLVYEDRDDVALLRAAPVAPVICFHCTSALLQEIASSCKIYWSRIRTSSARQWQMTLAKRSPHLYRYCEPVTPPNSL